MIVSTKMPSEINGFKVISRLGKGMYGEAFKVVKEGEQKEYCLKSMYFNYYDPFSFISIFFIIIYLFMESYIYTLHILKSKKGKSFKGE